MTRPIHFRLNFVSSMNIVGAKGLVGLWAKVFFGSIDR